MSLVPDKQYKENASGLHWQCRACLGFSLSLFPCASHLVYTCSLSFSFSLKINKLGNFTVGHTPLLYFPVYFGDLKLKVLRSLGTGGRKLPFVVSLCAKLCAGHGDTETCVCLHDFFPVGEPSWRLKPLALGVVCSTPVSTSLDPAGVGRPHRPLFPVGKCQGPCLRRREGSRPAAGAM